MASSEDQSLGSITNKRCAKIRTGTLFSACFEVLSSFCHLSHVPFSGLQQMHGALSLWGSFFTYSQGPLPCPVGFLNPVHISKKSLSEYLLYKSPNPVFDLLPKICFLSYLKKIQIKNALSTLCGLKIISRNLTPYSLQKIIFLWLRELQVLKSY